MTESDLTRRDFLARLAVGGPVAGLALSAAGVAPLAKAVLADPLATRLARISLVAGGEEQAARLKAYYEMGVLTADEVAREMGL